MSSGDDYKTLVQSAVRDADTFLRLTLSNKLRDDGTPWLRISVRPVRIKDRRMMQFSYFDGRKEIAKNFSADEAESRLDDVLAIPFGRVHVQTTEGDIHVRITRKGRALITRGKASRPEREPILAHDHAKSYPLPTGTPNAFLQAIGIMNEQGGILAGMQGKFHQINEFLRIVRQTIAKNASGGQPVRVVDCGCGSAYLTFAAYHYLKDMCGLPVEVVGIDVNEELVSKCAELRNSLGWPGLEFRVSRIAEFEPDVPPDMVLSLHACDTATDEAIARGILWGSRVILAAPCCQHELHDQLRATPFRPVLRHGVLKERFADILTDAFRALVLRIMGYRTSVIEFVSPEHTSKNLVIRAEKGLKPGDAAHIREYKDLKALWNVSPCIEGLLGQEIQEYLGP